LAARLLFSGDKVRVYYSVSDKPIYAAMRLSNKLELRRAFTLLLRKSPGTWRVLRSAPRFGLSEKGAKTVS
jgi:hypothetical protein